MNLIAQEPAFYDTLDPKTYIGDSWHLGGLWSLRDMLELKAAEFYVATRNLRNIKAIVENAEPDEIIPQAARQHLADAVEGMLPHLDVLRVPVTWMEADRTLKNLKTVPEITYSHLSDNLNQIDRRLQDELLLRKIFVLDQNRNKFFVSATENFGGPFFIIEFQSAVYEIDEAGKCLALDRGTACVFHLMRVLEIGIKAAAKCLGIADPIKDAERNWGVILRKLKDEIERRNKQTWAKPGDAQFFGEIYASLDAVRNVWRNATMHVEAKYTLEEAEHIFNATQGFMRKLASRCDEQGRPIA